MTTVWAQAPMETRGRELDSPPFSLGSSVHSAWSAHMGPSSKPCDPHGHDEGSSLEEENARLKVENQKLRAALRWFQEQTEKRAADVEMLTMWMQQAIMSRLPQTAAPPSEGDSSSIHEHHHEDSCSSMSPLQSHHMHGHFRGMKECPFSPRTQPGAGTPPVMQWDDVATSPSPAFQSEDDGQRDGSPQQQQEEEGDGLAAHHHRHDTVATIATTLTSSSRAVDTLDASAATYRFDYITAAGDRDGQHSPHTHQQPEEGHPTKKDPAASTNLYSTSPTPLCCRCGKSRLPSSSSLSSSSSLTPRSLSSPNEKLAALDLTSEPLSSFTLLLQQKPVEELTTEEWMDCVSEMASRLETAHKEKFEASKVILEERERHEDKIKELSSRIEEYVWGTFYRGGAKRVATPILLGAGEEEGAGQEF